MMTATLRSRYDVVVCGAGSSGSVVARRLAENDAVDVLLLEAGGTDEVLSVTDAARWALNLGSERDWAFAAEPDARLGGRSLAFPMGKVLGGGSSINLMIWARGHRSDWDYFAAESGEPAWSYDAVLQLYRSIEDWRGTGEPEHRGRDGLVTIEPAQGAHAVATAVVDAARTQGIPTYQSPNGPMMEYARGAAITDLRIHNGQRLSVFQTYTAPYQERPNLTVVPHALVTRVLLRGGAATGVEVVHDGALHQVSANLEVVLSLGAIQTPKVLMQSGIGDHDHLRRIGVPVVQHLPGVGRNLQDHFGFDCVWEYPGSVEATAHAAATLYWDSDGADLSGPDLFACFNPFPKASPENAAKYGLPPNSWILFGSPTHPMSRGRVQLSGPHPDDPVRIDANALSHPDDLKTAVACVDMLRDIGNSAPLRPFVVREVMPGPVAGAELEAYLRNAVSTYWHESGTAKMGHDDMSVVDGRLQVYGVDNLRVADASIMPRIASGNIMAPCVVIGERAAQFIHHDHRG